MAIFDKKEKPGDYYPEPAVVQKPKRSLFKWLALGVGTFFGVAHIGVVGHLMNRTQVPIINLPVGDYTAYTVDLILKHYPVESIKDIKSGIPFVNTVWDIKFINIEERTYDLNNLEHGILRKRWDDPRIHFAVNCASYSCPRLRDEAYVAEKLDQQLDDAGRKFLNDPRRNKVSKNDLQLSKIFNWYGSDFPNGTKFIRFLNQYTDIEINEDASISYLDYDWALNDSRKLGGE